MAPESAKKPLLMAGKKNLYQRVLTLPDAKLFPQQKSSPENAIQVPPFSPYYVYDRIKDGAQHEWLQVGLGRSGNVVGWMESDKTFEWNHGLTLSFRKPIDDKSRVLLFRDMESIKEIAETYDQRRYDLLYAAASKGMPIDHSPVAAIQPLKDIDIRKNFYLLPIHNYEEIYLNNSTAQLLEVSSIPLQNKKPENQAAQKVDSKNPYTANIVFAIDSTVSMQPYIERTHEAVRKIYDSLNQQSLLGSVQFGLIAFRDNPSAAENIEYLTRRYVSLEQGSNAASFMKSVESLESAQTPTKDFIEDSYAGIASALNEMDWAPDAARFIVLITDAGARDEYDPLGSTGLDAATLNQLAQEKNVAIFVLHLQTPDPMADHESAARQYRVLSEYPNIGNLYYAVPTGNLQEFGEVLDSLAAQISKQLTQVGVANNSQYKPSQNPQIADLQAKVAKLGYALRMQYLQKTQDGQAPDVFNAWLLDKSFHDPEKATVDVCVLLTRDQLSDLYNVLKKVLETGEQGLISPDNFLSELKSLAATITRDPQQLGGTTATTAGSGNSLADLGFVREYIEDLPYTGEVMNLSLQDWQSWSVIQQTEFLQRLEDKITYYQALHDHVDLWVSLTGGAIDGDSVYPVPLEMLP
ncbi:MAG: vWA domain-containing protein [Methylococcales bacterium]